MGTEGFYSDKEKYGEWRKDKCYCEKGDKVCYDDDIIKTITWKSTKLFNNHMRRLSTAGRIFTLGISEIWIKGQSLTHDFIEVALKCSKCNWYKFVTFDYGYGGKHWKIGYYRKTLSVNKVRENYDKTFLYVLNKLEDLPGFEGKDYSLTNNNCKTFAKSFWEVL